MEITFHGSANEVGRSCIHVDAGKKFLLDAGIKLSEEGTEYPLDIDEEMIEKIDAVFLGHAHLDHSGYLPMLNMLGLRCPIFCTKMTRVLTKILLKDSLHIEMLSGHPAYDENNIQNIISMMQRIERDKNYEHDGMKFKAYDAGHIPGSVAFEVKAEDKTILYTSDINTEKTYLMNGASVRTKNPDVMICESTYGDRNHPNRAKEENDFLDNVQKTLDHGGKVLIPAFGVGRSQEIMIMLGKRKWDVPVYIDGMAKKVTANIINNQEFINNIEELDKNYRKVRQVRGGKHREEIIKEQAIFLTTSGMLDGGPVIEYLKHIWFEKEDSILLTGYQAEGTNGRLLLEQGKAYLDGAITKVKGEVKKYDFSAHCGQKELHKLVKDVKPRNLILNHGDPEPISEFAKWAKAQGIKVFTPENGEKVKI